MSNLEKWINAILNEDAKNLSIGSVRTLQMIKQEMTRLQANQKDDADLSSLPGQKEAQGEWVSVEDGLPPLCKFGESDYLLCLTENTEQVVCYYSTDKAGWIVANYKANSEPLLHKITHYMPLPSPPSNPNK